MLERITLFGFANFIPNYCVLSKCVNKKLGELSVINIFLLCLSKMVGLNFVCL